MQKHSKFSLNSMSRRYIRTSAKAHLVLPVGLQEVVIGSILGDLGVERPNPQCNTRLQFKQTNKNIEYITHLYSLFQEFCGTPPKFMSRFDSLFWFWILLFKPKSSRAEVEWNKSISILFFHAPAITYAIAWVPPHISFFFSCPSEAYPF